MADDDAETPVGATAWYLPEWIDSDPEFSKRGGHTRFADSAGLKRSVVSALYNRRKPFNAGVVEQAAEALGIEVYELFMHPEQALAMRQVRLAAKQIVNNDPPPGTPGTSAAPPSKRTSRG